MGNGECRRLASPRHVAGKTEETLDHDLAALASELAVAERHGERESIRSFRRLHLGHFGVERVGAAERLLQCGREVQEGQLVRVHGVHVEGYGHDLERLPGAVRA